MQRVSAFNDGAFASYMMPAPRHVPQPQPQLQPQPQPQLQPQPQPQLQPQVQEAANNTESAALRAYLANLHEDIAQLHEKMRTLAATSATAATPATVAPVAATVPLPSWTPMNIAVFAGLLLVFGLFIMGIIITTRVSSKA